MERCILCANSPVASGHDVDMTSILSVIAVEHGRFCNEQWVAKYRTRRRTDGVSQNRIRRCLRSSLRSQTVRFSRPPIAKREELDGPEKLFDQLVRFANTIQKLSSAGECYEKLKTDYLKIL